MMKILLKNEFKMMVNTIRTQPGRNIAGFAIAMIVVLFMLYLLSSAIWFVSPLLDQATVDSALSFSFLIVIGMTILLGVPQVFKYLYSGSDLEMLFTMPIPTRHIFWIKYIKNYVGIPLFVFIFLAVPMTIYGISARVNLLFYPVALISLFAITIIGLSIAYLVNLIIIQIVPASRANEFMTVMSFLSGILVYLMFTLPNITDNDLTTEQVISTLPSLPKWTPMNWASAAIVSSGAGSFHFIIPLIALLLLTGVMMVITTSLVDKGFRTGYIRLSEGTGKKRKRRKRKKDHRKELSLPMIAVGKKEWLAIKRDMREWFVFLPVVFFVVFGLIGFFGGGGNLTLLRENREITWPAIQGLLLFVSGLANGLITASSIGREGPNLWILQVLPLSGKQIAVGKFWISWLIPLFIITFIEGIAFLFLGWTIVQFIFGLLIQAVVTLGMSAIGLWLGTIGAKHHPTNPQARLNFGVSFLLFVLSYVYIIIAAIPVTYLVIPLDLIELPAGLEHGIPGFFGVIATVVLSFLAWKISYPFIMTIVGLLILLIVSGGIAALFIILSAQQIDKGLKINMISETNIKPLFGRRKSSGGSLY